MAAVAAAVVRVMLFMSTSSPRVRRGVRLLNALQPASLERLHGPGPLARRLRDLLDRQVAQDAEEQDRPLVGRQVAQELQHAPPIEADRTGRS